MSDIKCAGCGLERDNSTAIAYRPDALGNTFTLCRLCVRTVVFSALPEDMRSLVFDAHDEDVKKQRETAL